VKSPRAVNPCDSLGLVFALGFHTLFEGIALGLMPKVDQATELATGLLIHKAVEVFSLGSNLANNGHSVRRILVLLLIIGLMNTAGILIGVAVTKASKLVDVVFLSLSAGMMLYAACSGILVNEFKDGKKHQLCKFLMVVLGVATIACLWFFEVHAHDHGAGGHAAHKPQVVRSHKPHGSHQGHQAHGGHGSHH